MNGAYKDTIDWQQLVHLLLLARYEWNKYVTVSLAVRESSFRTETLIEHLA